jgi:ABC-type amino acid transport system permease subunit
VKSAYRLFHLTETTLLKVVNNLLVSVDEKDVATVIAFLDQSAAFDLVDHQILIDRLSSGFGFRGLTLVWFRSYLSN